MSDKSKLPAPLQAKKLKKKKFSSTGDVHILGDVEIASLLVIGGDLLVDGDLSAEEVFCLGKLTVTGNIRVHSLYIGQALDVGGDIEVQHLLKTGCNAEWMARMLELDISKSGKFKDNFLDDLVHPLILKRSQQQMLAANVGGLAGVGDIQALGFLACDVLDCQGDVQIDFVLEANEVQYVGGHLGASAVFVASDCHVKGELFSESDIRIGGDAFAGAVICQGNLSVASICAQANMSAWGTIRATGEISSLNGEIVSGRWIATRSSIFAARYLKAGEAIVAEKGITVGDDFAVMAGLALRRSKWATLGFVGAPKRPVHLLSGQFDAKKTRKHLDALEKKRDSELDWEIERRLKAELEE